MIVAGMLCLAGVLGPALRQMHIQHLEIGSYAFVLPVAWFSAGDALPPICEFLIRNPLNELWERL